MDDLTRKVDELREEIFTSNLNRRTVLKRALALGLSAPVIAGLLAACGGDDDDDDATATEDSGSGQEATEVATEAEGDATEMATEAEGDATEMATEAEEEATEEATEAEEEATEEMTGERGGGGRVNLLNWQAASILNPHLAQGGKDFTASNICLDPLAEFGPDGELVAKLAAEIPSIENGLVAADGTSVTWPLKEGVVWQDGTPFTAADCVFTWELVVDPEAPTTTKSNFEAVESMEAVDDHTLLITFREPTPAWFDPFTTTQSMVVPQHLLQDWMGAALNDAPFNLAPIGTGPYTVTDFRPQDTVLYEINMDYYGNPQFFDTVELKGGGDATSAASSVLETGDIDYALNLQVEAEILVSMEAAGVGQLVTIIGPGVERILINRTDPNVEVDGERSHISTQHPALSELEFRQALTYLCDRETIAQQLYGPAGIATSNILTAPPRFVSPNTSFEFNVETAAQMLADAGWVQDGDSLSKNGYTVDFLYQSSTNSVRQKTQEIVKQSMEEVGMKVELKAIDAGVFFSSDPGNPDTYTHFYADLEMFTNSGTVYPIRYMGFYKSTAPEEDIPQASNEWSGRNIDRWIGTDAANEYNELWLSANQELDPDAQDEVFIAMNDILVNDVVEIPLVARLTVDAKVNGIVGNVISPWAASFWDIQDWSRES